MTDNKFNYNYSAERHEEVSRIREKYLPKEQQEQAAENKLERLRKLDSSCESKAQTAGLILGIVGVLVFGLSMCCFLVWEQYILGSLIAVVGIPMMVLAKPVHDRVLSKARAQAAPEILRLSSELEQGE